MTCHCPKLLTARGPIVSGWDRECPEHGEPAPHAAHQPPVKVNATEVWYTADRHGWHCPCVACRIDRGED